MCDLVVMVVEPDPKDLGTICRSLETMGVNRIICACNAQQALEVVLEDKGIDIVIVSEDLKGLSGSEVIKSIKKIDSSILCILCDETKDALAGLMAKLAGATDFIRKQNFSENLNEVMPQVINRAELYNRLWINQ